MRKLLIATVLLVFLITGLYLALPAIAEYSVRQALTEQQIDASFVLQRPSFNRVEVRELKLKKNTAEQAFTLTADSIMFTPSSPSFSLTHQSSTHGALHTAVTFCISVPCSTGLCLSHLAVGRSFVRLSRIFINCVAL